MKIGDTFTVKKVVTEDMTAAALGSGGLPVFGTPYLVAMVENAAFTYLQQELPEGKSTVGTKVEVSHVSPSPVGMEITVTVEVTDISANGKMVDFKASATDTAGPHRRGHAPARRHHRGSLHGQVPGQARLIL